MKKIVLLFLLICAGSILASAQGIGGCFRCTMLRTAQCSEGNTSGGCGCIQGCKNGTCYCATCGLCTSIYGYTECIYGCNAAAPTASSAVTAPQVSTTWRSNETLPAQIEPHSPLLAGIISTIRSSKCATWNGTAIEANGWRWTWNMLTKNGTTFIEATADNQTVERLAITPEGWSVSRDAKVIANGNF